MPGIEPGGPGGLRFRGGCNTIMRHGLFGCEHLGRIFDPDLMRHGLNCAILPQ